MPSTSSVQYDVLVLAPGLRDTDADRLRRRHGPAAGLFSPHDPAHEQAAAGFAQREVAGRPDARCAVYGTSIATLVAAAQLMDLGVTGQQITVITASKVFQPIPEDRACEIALAAAAAAGVKIMEGAAIFDIEVRARRLTGVILEDEQVVPCDMLLCLSTPGIDPRLFAALNDQSLVLDGRLVVDGAFRTNDPAIYAGGDLVKLSRRAQDPRRFDSFNQRELGDRLADAVLASVDPNAAAQGRVAPSKVPVLVEPLAEAGRLPGGRHYCRAWASPGLFPTGSIETDIARDLVTETDDGSYSRLTVDKYGRVASACFLGPGPLREAWTVRALVGLPVTYLNDLVGRVDRGQMADMRAFLFESEWARALYHDRFPELRRQLESGAETSPYLAAVVKTLWDRVSSQDTSDLVIETLLPQEAARAVQDGLNSFLECNSDALPGYITAARAVEMSTNGGNIWTRTAAKVGLVVGDVPLMDNSL